jgi:hypothetical protein
LIKHRRGPLLALGWVAAAAAALVVGYLLVRVLPVVLAHTKGLTNPSQKLAEEGRVRTALLAFLGGAVAFAGAVYTARTFSLSRKGQITERFTRAIDQLGNDKIDVRLGGMYALERLARESREDHGPIMEIVTAYVREHSPWPPREPAEVVPSHSESRSTGDGGRPSVARIPPPVEVEVKAAINVLLRRNRAYDAHQPVDFDLGATNLSAIKTEGLCLVGAYLSGTQLQRATLIGADLRHTNLIGARLDGAVLHNAKLAHARLQSAVLRNAHLLGADLSKADLTGADLRGAYYDARTKWPDGYDATAAGAIGFDASQAVVDVRERDRTTASPPAMQAQSSSKRSSSSAVWLPIIAVAGALWRLWRRKR